MGTRSEYINEFISVQELESVKKTTTESTVSLRDDDLFLVSQLSAEADRQIPIAVAVSRKLRYGDLSGKIAEDLEVSRERYKIDSLSSDIAQLSSYTHNVINKKIDNYYNGLSTQVDADYVKKYTLSIDIPKGYTIRDIRVNDGQVQENVGMVPLSDFITIEGTSLASGTLDGSVLNTYTHTLTSNDDYVVTYQVKNDCYLIININVYEEDCMQNPMEVSLGDILTGKDKDEDIKVRKNLVKVAQFSSSGAFSGKLFKIYYSCGIPVKAGTKVQVYYYDLENFRYNSSEPSTFIFREMKLHATIAESSLDTRVMTDDRARSNKMSLYKIETNNQGLVISADSVTKEDLVGMIGKASVSNNGVVKTNYTRNNLNFPVRIDKSGDLYSEMSYSSRLQCGVIKVGGKADHTDPKKQILPLSVDDEGNAFTKMGIPTNAEFGTIKSGLSYGCSGDNNETRQIYVTEDGIPRVDFPVETWTFTLKDGSKIKKTVSVTNSGAIE